MGVGAYVIPVNLILKDAMNSGNGIYSRIYCNFN